VPPDDHTKLICTAALWINPLVALRSFFVCARKLAQKHTSLPADAATWCPSLRQPVPRTALHYGKVTGELSHLEGELLHLEGKLSRLEGELSRLEGELSQAAAPARRRDDARRRGHGRAHRHRARAIAPGAAAILTPPCAFR
jgi:hypothetical protein